jgi:hypothetical protein
MVQLAEGTKAVGTKALDNLADQRGNSFRWDSLTIKRSFSELRVVLAK